MARANLAGIGRAGTRVRLLVGSWFEPFPGWEPTRYEEKARLEGRLVSHYLNFIRR